MQRTGIKSTQILGNYDRDSPKVLRGKYDRRVLVLCFHPLARWRTITVRLGFNVHLAFALSKIIKLVSERRARGSKDVQLTFRASSIALARCAIEG